MDDLNSLANAVLANAPALALVIGTIVAIGVIVVIVILLWPRKPPHDPAAEQRMADLNARVQIMGELLAKAQSQLQQTVHERLDAVTARLGESMQNSTQHGRAPPTTERAARRNRPRAKEHYRPGLAGHEPAECAQQQADTRRVWPGADGNDHSGRPAAGLL